MRFLHTADWHLGKKLRGRSRLPEQRAALQQLGDAAIAHAVDAVLVAGDVYESTMPPPEAEQLAFEFLARMSQAGIACVVIAGNHDQPQRLAALQPLLESLRIHVRAEVREPDQGGIVMLPSRDGKERARIGTLPFVAERKLLDTAMLQSGTDQSYQVYKERIRELLSYFDEAFTGDAINVLVAHLLVGGARFGTGERQLHLGEVFAIEPPDLPANAGYIALGHLHRPQEIAQSGGRAVYAGSLIELDFGEREQDKRAVLVEIERGLPARLTSVPLTAGRRLRDVRGTLQELERQQQDLAAAFLRVTVLVPEPSPGIEDRVRAFLPDAVEVRQEWPRAAATPEPVDAVPDRRPQDLFADFHRRELGAPPSDALAALFTSLHQQAQRDASGDSA